MIMGQLTASGVKLVLPHLIRGLEDKARGAGGGAGLGFQGLLC
jgi:hypothetical protein